MTTVLTDNITFAHTHPPILEEEINTFEGKPPLKFVICYTSNHTLQGDCKIIISTTEDIYI
jgi:hypothetical protein